eukprot:897478-Prymnesium_polylepis.1
MQDTIATVNEKVRTQENVLRMRGILTAELQGAGVQDLLTPTRTLVFEGPVKLRVEGSLRPEWRAKRCAWHSSLGSLATAGVDGAALGGGRARVPSTVLGVILPASESWPRLAAHTPCVIAPRSRPRSGVRAPPRELRWLAQAHPKLTRDPTPPTAAA